MAQRVVLPKDFDVSRISFGAPKQLDSGGRSVFISYAGAPLLVQTPEMPAPFGVSAWVDERTGVPSKYNLDVSFAGRETRPALQHFHDMLKAIDDALVTAATDNSAAWFKKRFPSRDVVEALYTPLVKQAKDRETGEATDRFPPTFKMGLPYKDGQFKLDGVYDEKRAPLDLLELANREGRGKGSRVRAIIQCSGVWVAGGKFGCTWKVKQLIVEAPAVLKAYAFVPDEEDDERVVAATQQGRSAVPAQAARPSAFIESSDDEDANPDL